MPVSDLRFRPSVYAIIIQEDNILLSPQWDGYDVPGGGIDLGETVEEGLIREVKEETGFDVAIDGIIDCQTSFFQLPERENGCVQSIMLFYKAHITGGDFSIEGFDKYEQKYAQMAQWVDVSKIDELKFYCSVDLVSIIKKVFRNS